ncbi:MAG: hypothetical protein V4692_13175 [Bdellovibrionota bacterium]
MKKAMSRLLMVLVLLSLLASVFSSMTAGAATDDNSNPEAKKPMSRVISIGDKAQALWNKMQIQVRKDPLGSGTLVKQINLTRRQGSYIGQGERGVACELYVTPQLIEDPKNNGIETLTKYACYEINLPVWYK